MLIARLILSYVVLVFADAFAVAAARIRRASAYRRPPTAPVPSLNTPPAAAVTSTKLKRSAKPPTALGSAVAASKELFQRFGNDSCPAWAAALSFFSILSIPPILLCGLAILGYVIKSPDIAALQTQHIVERMIPGTGTRIAARNLLEQLNVEKSAEAVRKRRGTTGLIGIALLLWSAMQIFVSASTPMNAAFRAKETRNWFQLRYTALFLLIGSALLFALSLLPSAGLQVIKSLHVPVLSTLPMPSPFWVNATLWAFGIVVNMALFTMIYRYLPSPQAKVTWRVAAFAGGIVAILWEIAKEGFGLYLIRMGGAASYDKVYGSLGGLFLLVFWIYYSSLLLLLGAEIAQIYAERIGDASTQ
jgi:membrane protein